MCTCYYPGIVRQFGLITPHFRWHEAHCNSGMPMPDHVAFHVERVAHEMERLRARIGAPIKVISWYRSPEHNKRVGGAEKSRHLSGQGIDFQVKDWTGVQLAREVEAMIATGDLIAGGVGTYTTNETCHYDIRGVHARWGPHTKT